jgi:hypothetical protein
MIVYTKHAEEKFRILKEQGFIVKKKMVEKVINSPDAVDHSQFPLLVAQKSIDEKHILKVVFKKENGIIKIITFYPMRKKKLKNK